MADTDAPLRLYNIYAPARDGLVASITEQSSLYAQSIWVRNDSEERVIGLVRPSVSPKRYFDYIDPTGALIEFAIGAVDQAPTGGTFSGSSNSDATGLTGLAYNISDASLQTLLNTNPDVTSGGATVAVTKLNTQTWKIVWSAVGARNLIAWDSTNLLPTCTATASRYVTGDSTHKEEQILRICQRPYGYNATWSATTSAVTATISDVQVGTASKPAIQRLALTPEPYDGSFVLNFARAQVTKVICKGNTNGAKEVSTIQCLADGAAYEVSRVQCLADAPSLTLDGKYFDLDSASGISRVWIRLVEASTSSLSIATGSKAFTIRAGLGYASGIFRAESDASPTVNYMEGTFSTYSSTTLTLTITTIGGSGSHADWSIYLTGTEPGVPVGGSLLEVRVAPMYSATLVASTIAAVVDASALWGASSVSALITITDATRGARVAIDDGDSGFGVARVTAGAASTKHDKVVATLADSSGPVQVLLSNGGTIATAPPAGGRRITVTLVDGSSASTIATAVQSAVDGDAQFVATVSTSLVTVTDVGYGVRTIAAVGSSGFAVARITTGAYGDLHDKSLLLYDNTNSSVAVYLTETGSTPAAGHAALNASRYLSVTIAHADSATTVGAAVNTATNAGDFSSSVSSGTVTITNTTSGERTAFADTDSTFAISTTTAGLVLAINVPVDATEGDLEVLLGNGFDVVKSDKFTWDMTFGVNGAQNAFTSITTAVRLPLTVKGTISLATTTCLAAFDAQIEDNITAIEEGQVTFPGKAPWTFYRRVVTIYKDVIDFSTLAPPSSGSYALLSNALAIRQDITSLALLAAVTTAGGVAPKAALVSIASTARLWELVAGTDATVSGFIQRPTDYNASTNAYVWKAVF